MSKMQIKKKKTPLNHYGKIYGWIKVYYFFYLLFF